MIGPKLLLRIREIYDQWLQHDQFGRIVVGYDPRKPVPYRSVREFIKDTAMMAAHDASIPELANTLRFPEPPATTLTLREFFEQPIRSVSGERVSTVVVAARKFLCHDHVPGIISEVFTYSPMSEEDRVEQEALLKESGLGSHDALRAQLQEPERVECVARTLFDALLSKIGSRSLRSFFVRQPNDDGYRAWWSGAKTNCGKPLTKRTIATNSGSVVVEVQRYHTEVESVRAYEWSAELRVDSKSSIPDAVAVGMVYVFIREDGEPVGDTSDLLWAADTVADVDVTQVHAFLEQHDDSFDLVQESDLCFVWLWEKRQQKTMPHRAGRDCLEAALKDLKKRFSRMATVVLDVKPYQFDSWDGSPDLPSIQVEKQEAIDKLIAYIETLRLGDVIRGECRLIVNRNEQDPNAVIGILGRDSLEQILLSGGSLF